MGKLDNGINFGELDLEDDRNRLPLNPHLLRASNASSFADAEDREYIRADTNHVRSFNKPQRKCRFKFSLCNILLCDSDLTPAYSSSPEARRELADLIRDACVNVGFFYVSNHTIPEQVINTAIDAAKRFFALSTEEKMRLDIHATTNYKGYTALLAENTDPNNAGDLHEGFDIGPEGSSDPVKMDAPMAGGNVWPPDEIIPGFKKDVLKYYESALNLGRTLSPLFALALDLEEDFFTDKTRNSAAILRLLHYPPQEAKPADKVIGIGAHTDYECFTLLYQDASGGLQVQNADGRWIDAVPIPGTIVVNLGDQFARWTNDTFKSTPHRAINSSGSERYSIPLFFGTDYEVLLEPIRTCVSETNPPKYPVVKAGDYVRSRLEATYQ
ncbi:hypothetical protein PC9H_010492 [Pleurotus ostreatus]|uniref:Fe2OG dioxygenase domain-containing protein n=1 Tax=Pleurotus ostreatus TaxID=5322 RepID=A0A8H7DM15_PLEOS|nr:uncharacterized protein PC9H_010492 [Pleurotus ostreatus]KAF7422336.1 hypothetical protein PC9H_010492 [Pleurotus ostreatus]